MTNRFTVSLRALMTRPLPYLLLALMALSGAGRADTFEVTNNSDGATDGTCNVFGTGDGCTLREAINAANNTPFSNNITFNATAFATAQTITVGSQLPTFTFDITLTGPAAGVTVSASANSFDIFQVNRTANFSRLTIRNGNRGIISISFGTVNATNCTFSNNVDGIINGLGNSVTATNCTFSGNSGTGIGNNGGLTAINCTFSGNGTGIAEGNGYVTAINCTVSGNGTGTNNSSGSSVNFQNTICAGNTTNTAGTGTITDGGNNILTGTAADAGLDPAGLKDNGGPTQTIALLPSSVAIDAGSNALIPNGITNDQRGTGYPRIVGGTVDIGAFEYEPSQSGPNFVVTAIADSDDGVCGAGNCTLREAINAANSGPDVSEITFDPTVFNTAQTITVGSQLPTFTTDITLTGPAAGVTVSASANSFDVFKVSGIARFNGLTISNGRIGIANDYLSGPLTATNCTFSGSTVGIRNGGTFTAVNCTLSGNDTGINNRVFVFGTFTAVNCTLSGNGTGINNNNGSINNTVTMKNTLCAGNTTDVSGPLEATSSYNLIGNGTGMTGISDGTNGNQIGTGAAPIDPKLNALANNGGPTQTMSLQVGSPALNAGSNALIPGGITTDQRGFGYARISAGTVDIGAFESPDTAQTGPNFVVNKITDTDDGVCGTQDCTLREVIRAANSNADVSEITFDPTVFNTAQTITVGSTLLDIGTDITFTGPAAGVTVSASANSFKVFVVNSGNASFSGLTISNGSTGIENQNGTLTTTNCTFSGNSTAGIENFNAMTSTNCTFSNNAKGISNYVAVTAINCTFSGSSTAGIFNNNLFSTVTVSNCTLSGNGTGIINNSFGTVTLANTLCAGNTTNTTGTITDGGNNLLSGDPKLKALANNGGPTQTMSLQAGSPALNAGSNALIPGGITTDQRGTGFLRIVGGTVDIGAFELTPLQTGPNFVVNSTADTDDGACTVDNCTLREAIHAANGNASIITFDATVFATAQIINLTGVLPDLSTDMDIQGPSVGATVRRDTGGDYRIFHILTGKTVSLSHLTIANGNSATYGGGIWNEGGTLTVTTCTLSGNTASSRGGGIYNLDGTLTVTNSTLSGNSSSSRGGGIENSGTLTVTNCTLSGNTANTEGGGIENFGTLTVTNSTLSGNSATASGGGILRAAGTVNVGNSLIAGNTGTSGTDVYGTVTSQGYNLIGKGDDSTGFTNGTNGDQVGTSANLLDAKLGALANNGGPTQTMSLQAGSPALNAGSNALIPVGITTDQRGSGFLRIVDGTVDIGAFESLDTTQTGPNFVVSSTADTDDGACTVDNCTLREAINAANANADASQITFAPTVFATAQTITVGSQLPTFTTGITLTGPTTGVTVSASANSFDVFKVNSGVTANFSRLTISNGSKGINNFGATLTATNCTFNNNGYGIFNISNTATLTATNCTFNNNGYGIQSAQSTPTTTTTNCTFSGNIRGIDNYSTATATNCTFSGNSGSGIYISFGTVTATNCTVSGNATGIANFDRVTATNCTVSGNATGIANSGNTVTLKNTICAGNTTNTSGTITDGGNNILSGDPKLNALANNGGPTQTMSLQAGSPALNAGSNALIPVGITTDQRGTGFPRIVGGTVDIGAFEAQPQVDTTAPVSVTISNPAASATVGSLGAISGAAQDNAGGSGIKSVRVLLHRYVSGSTQYWNGTAWTATGTYLATTLGSPNAVNTTWSVSGGLPSGGNLPNGTYYLRAWAYDQGNLSVFSGLQSFIKNDTTAPVSVTITTPAASATVGSLGAISGAAQDDANGSGIKRVTVSLHRYVSGSTQYWNGTAWTTTGAYLATTLSSPNAISTNWSVSGGLPSGGNLPNGTYYLRAWAYDQGNLYVYSGLQSFIKNDTTAPLSVTITNPVPGSTGSTLNGISGAAQDDAGGSGIKSVRVLLHRIVSGSTQYWNGTAWSATGAYLATTLGSPNAVNTTWSVLGSLPSGVDLPNGTYYLRAWAYDQGNLYAYSGLQNFIVSSSGSPRSMLRVARVSSPVASSVQSSSAVVSSSSILLTFAGSVPQSTFTVTVNGKAVAVSDTLRAKQSVTLLLPDKSLQAGDTVVVAWNGGEAKATAE